MNNPREVLDLLIVGAGPAGLAAACAAQDAGLKYLVVERRGPVQSLVEHPQQIRYFSPADEMAVGNVPFPMAGGHKPTREDALAYYRAVAASRNLALSTWDEVVSVTPVGDPPHNGYFRVRSHRRVAGEGESIERDVRYLLVCTGTFPNPRRLHHIPGADLPKVMYRLQDPTPYFGREVLVVGGGNSVATSAMTLAESGAKVTVATRRPPVDFQSHLRPFIVRDLKIMADEKRLALISYVELSEITPTTVTLTPYLPYAENDEQRQAAPQTVANDFVFAMLGHTADFDLFAHLGVPLAADGLPVYDEATAETPIPGLFVAGALSRANIILESRKRAVEIVTAITLRLSMTVCSSSKAS